MGKNKKITIGIAVALAVVAVAAVVFFLNFVIAEKKENVLNETTPAPT